MMSHQGRGNLAAQAGSQGLGSTIDAQVPRGASMQESINNLRLRDKATTTVTVREASNCRSKKAPRPVIREALACCDTSVHAQVD